MLLRPTTVVNIRTARDVIEQARAEGRYVLIDRTSIWGNPYSHMQGTTASFLVASRDEAIDRYDAWLSANPLLVARLSTLKGCVLGCWCMPKYRCHGLVLARRADAA